jgi:hypothetical protein
LRRRLVLSLAIGFALATVPSPVSATEVSRARFHELIEDAPGDKAALAELSAVRSVDGRPVDMRRALDGASPEELATRLEALRVEGSVPPSRTGPVDPRSEARDILSEPRFADADEPRPLEGLTDWLDETFGGALDPLRDFVVRVLPGGVVTFWVLLVSILAIVTFFLAGRWGDRAAGRRSSFGATDDGNGDEDPRRLERDAEAAERAGDLDASLRLRFRAGLLRLADRGVVPRRTSMTSEEIGALVRSQTFDRLASTFDRVVYGRRPASSADIDEAKSGWKALSGKSGKSGKSREART